MPHIPGHATKTPEKLGHTRISSAWRPPSPTPPHPPTPPTPPHPHLSPPASAQAHRLQKPLSTPGAGHSSPLTPRGQAFSTLSPQEGGLSSPRPSQNERPQPALILIQPKVKTTTHGHRIKTHPYHSPCTPLHSDKSINIPTFPSPTPRADVELKSKKQTTTTDKQNL